jgi:cold shock protein
VSTAAVQNLAQRAARILQNEGERRMARITGTVKWFSDAKGYGFIERDEGDDIFVHHASIEGTGFKTLKEGERVEFDVLEEDKGPKAQNVARLDAVQEDPGRRARAFQSPLDHSGR